MCSNQRIGNGYNGRPCGVPLLVGVCFFVFNIVMNYISMVAYGEIRFESGLRWVPIGLTLAGIGCCII